jgi:hypothetical protein
MIYSIILLFQVMCFFIYWNDLNLHSWRTKPLVVLGGSGCGFPLILIAGQGKTPYVNSYFCFSVKQHLDTMIVVKAFYKSIDR